VSLNYSSFKIKAVITAFLNKGYAISSLDKHFMNCKTANISGTRTSCQGSYAFRALDKRFLSWKTGNFRGTRAKYHGSSFRQTFLELEDR